VLLMQLLHSLLPLLHPLVLPGFGRCCCRALAPAAALTAAAVAMTAASTAEGYLPLPAEAATAALVGAMLPSNMTLTLQDPGPSLPVEAVVKPALQGKHLELPSEVL
jgi:hypothetical protein